MTSGAPVPWRPIIAGFHPDPSICRVGSDYYVACSSFEYFPGVPIWHSTDLQSWQLLGNALDRPDQLPLTGVIDSQGVYAPTLRHHDGLFWLITTVVGVPGHCIFTAEHAAGPWSDPVVVDLVGIDPDLAWDDDGICYLTWADNHSDDDLVGIKQVRVDPHTGAVLSAPRQPWSGTGLQYPEGPHLYHVDDWWYLLIAEGGTHAGHAVSVSRSRSPEGPFEGAPTNPIQSHRSLGHPVQNTGHADLVRTPEGWAMVMLAVRRLGGFPFYHLLGRETFLADVTWRDGWPVVDLVSGTVGDNVTWRDEFDGAALAPAWVSVRERPRGSWSLSDHPGRLTLSASTASGTDTFLGHRQQHLSCTVRMKVHADELTYGGLRLRMSDRHHYDVEVAGGGVHARATIGPLTQTLDSMPLRAGDVVLRITTVRNSAPTSVAQHPDLVSLGVEIGDEYTELATLDGRYLSTEVAGGFTGRVVGPYVAAGRLLVDWVDYVGSDR